MKALVCGSFDPITFGHIDLIKRAASMFESVTVGIFINPDKKYLFSEEKRLQLVKEAIKDIPNASADISSGMVAHYCQKNGIGAIVKGVRNEKDFAYEAKMAEFNKRLAPDTETVLILASPETAEISSTLVRELGASGGDLSALAPECVIRAIEEINC